MKSIRLVKTKRKIIPIFFACDDNFVPYMIVSLKSLIVHASSQNEYRIHILYTQMSKENREKVKKLETDYCQVYFENVTEYLLQIDQKVSVRDYYSITTYYRIFIAQMFPKYNKVIYMDGDTIVLKDIALLYEYELGDHYIGAMKDQLVVQNDIFATYVTKVLGVKRDAYFNAGVLLINCRQFRKQNILGRFLKLIMQYTFVVAQDQDYLNVICKDKVLWLSPIWNVQIAGNLTCEEKDICLIHYNLAIKPWHYKDCRLGSYFWKYAKMTQVYQRLVQSQMNYSMKDRQNDMQSKEKLMQLAIEEINNKEHYYRPSQEKEDTMISRYEILKKIQQLEMEGRFDEDVEDDPPGKILTPNEIDYLRKKMKSRIRTIYAYQIARRFLNKMIRKKKIIIKEIVGIENLQGLTSGAIITCNHFNPLDSFAMQIAYDEAHQHKRKLFRIIKEGNYTSFPGFYGFLMRNCYTLPLSSNKDTMKKFIESVCKILKKGHFILIYPEQSLWWNYRKPKPLKKGAFSIAATNDVPVLPCFITMEDSDIMDEYGYPVQEYTIHIANPMYPDQDKTKAENVRELLEKNEVVWKEIYEKFYGIPLEYERLD